MCRVLPLDGPPIPNSSLEFFFQEQSYSSLHSGWSLAWDHIRGDIDDPCGTIADICGVIADFCGVIADPCGVVAIPEAIGTATSAIARSYRRYRRGVSGNISDSGVGITPQMCNRVTNHGDMSTFSKPDLIVVYIEFA